jgi:hypothetical protein
MARMDTIWTKALKIRFTEKNIQIKVYTVFLPIWDINKFSNF